MNRTRATLLLGALVLALPAPAQDPFARGTRWTFAASSQSAWLPESVSFAARENVALVAAGGATPSLAVLDRAAWGAQAPRFADTTFPAGSTHLVGVSGWNEDLFGAVQVPAPDATHRATRVARHDVVAAARGADFAPAWTHDAGFVTNGPARLAADRNGDRLVLAVWDSAQSRLQLDFLDGETGALAARVERPAAALNALEISEEGDVVAVTAGLDLLVFDGDGVLLHEAGLSAATRALSLSADGESLAVGGIGSLAVLTRNTAGNWIPTFSASAGKDHVVTALDLSRDGGVLAVGWWNYHSGVDVRLELWEPGRGTRTNSVPIGGDAGDHQNMPQVVEVTPDGGRAAFGLWGTENGWPEVLVLAKGEDLPLYGVDTPGSVRDLDLSESGTRLLIAYKDTHQNVFGKTGGVLLHESGDQSVSQLGPAATGQTLEVATRLTGAGVGFLLIGDRDAPVQFPGVTGTLHLDRTSLTVLAQPTTAGRADFDVDLPDDPSLVGTQLSMQPAWRAAGGTVLGPELIDPLVVE